MRRDDEAVKLYHAAFGVKANAQVVDQTIRTLETGTFTMELQIKDFDDTHTYAEVIWHQGQPASGPATFSHATHKYPQTVVDVNQDGYWPKIRDQANDMHHSAEAYAFVQSSSSPINVMYYEINPTERTPSIGSRARRLRIRPWFIQYLFEREILFRKSSQIHEDDWKKTWNYTFTQISNYFYPPNVHPRMPVDLASTTSISSNELVRSMIKAVKCMTNVTEYEFQWRDMPVNPETLSLLSSTRAAFHSNLTKLVIRCRISLFNKIMSFTDFRDLTELELHFDYDPSTDKDIGYTNEKFLLDSIAPFINHLTPTLHSFTISSAAKGDHSSFLRALGPFPVLRSLNLRISIETEYLSDPAAINDLLLRHKSYLTNVSVRPDCKDGPIKALAAWPAVSALCMANLSWLNNLESLSFPAPHLPTMLALIHYAPAHLTSLALFGSFLGEAEVATVIGVLGARSNMQALSLDVKEISPELFALLANTFPLLHSLTLVLETSPDLYHPGKFNQKEYVYQTEWDLYDLAIYHRYHKDDFVSNPVMELEYGLMWRLIRCALPNVRSFKGKGHTLRDWDPR
ncbi:hypothetical protein C0991_008594 [Blastosporella zonata]|nr:hypothetical protein C0991_008594 [Blastosporella zonata]